MTRRRRARRWPPGSAPRRRSCWTPAPRIGCDPDWVYGFPELTAGQAGRDRRRARVSPIPAATRPGRSLLLRPLVDAGMLPRRLPDHRQRRLRLFRRRQRHDRGVSKPAPRPDFELYGLSLEHKHLPEMQRYGGLIAPADLRALGRRFPPGHDGLQCRCTSTRCPAGPRPPTSRPCCAARYAGCELCARRAGRRQGQAGAAGAERHQPAGAARARQCAARPGGAGGALDNLGKGASGAAVQNIGLMLGVPVQTRLPAAAGSRGWTRPGRRRSPRSSRLRGQGAAAPSRRLRGADRRGDRRRRDRGGDEHLVPLRAARRHELHPHRRAHEHPGRHHRPRQPRRRGDASSATT